MRRIVKEYDRIVLQQEDLQGYLDLRGIFGRRAPFHLEIGSGKGTFLVHEAQAHPECDFLGIEWARRYYRLAQDRLGRWGIENVRIIRADAVTFLREHIPVGAVDCLHVYFPDPWPKKRHLRRRLIQQANMDLLIGCLKPGGQLRLATDHEGYFEQMKAVTSMCRDTLEEIEFVRPAGAREGEQTGTNFERKYIRDKRTTHTLALQKKSD